jgi:hypothetical protein
MAYTDNFSFLQELHDEVSPIFIICAGTCKMGKTSLMTRIIFELRNSMNPHNHKREPLWDDIYIFTPSGDFDMFKKPYPGHVFEDGFDEFKIDSIYQRAKENRDMIAKRKNISANDAKKFLPRVLIVIDDVLEARSAIRGSKIIEKLAAMGRHVRIGVILAIQDLTMITPKTRSLYTHFFITCMSSDRIELIYGIQNYFNSKKDYMEFVNRYTSPHHFCLFFNYKRQPMLIYPPKRDFSIGPSDGPVKRPTKILGESSKIPKSSKSSKPLKLTDWTGKSTDWSKCIPSYHRILKSYF